jgi:CheY-like chemotaxis protein
MDAPPDLPLISLSMPGSLRAAQALGIENYLIKPVLRERLLDAIACLDRPVHKVLIVDDDPQLVEMISRMLQSAGDVYQPIQVFGGAKALAQLRQERIDLVLLDLVMPEVSGLQVLEEMKATPALAQIPVIVISAQYPETTQAEGRLFLSLVRHQNASTMETLNCLQALVGVLPMRSLPVSRAAPTSSPTLLAPLAS